jgi:hypothetical protein
VLPKASRGLETSDIPEVLEYSSDGIYNYDSRSEVYISESNDSVPSARNSENKEK